MGSGDLNGALQCCFLGPDFDVAELKKLANEEGEELQKVRRPLNELARCCTLLHSAARFGHLKAVEDLLAEALPVDAVTEEGVNLNYEGATPLLLAARFGHQHVVKKLLE